ncbi:MAG: hypothetical protein HPPSJP_2120 [Candidatus Hepatoplasma scabrum]|nr:MAG: hypothetical protein HPPSJP_2120 [Candidatus Hepatoplasma sp.]
MENKGIELFTWIRKIEFDRIKNYYCETLEKKELDYLNKYLNFEKFKNPNKKEFNQLINNFENNNNFDPRKIDEKLKRKESLSEQENLSSKIYNMLFLIWNEMEIFAQGKYNKIKKHKLIYFMIAYAINKNKDYGIFENPNEIFKKIYSKNEKNQEAKWWAFDNGPVLSNIYKKDNGYTNNDIDDNLILKNEQNFLNIFKIAYLVLRNFTTNDLIEESHKTDPWKKVYKPNSKHTPIDNKDIINYFTYNEPFFNKFIR